MLYLKCINRSYTIHCCTFQFQLRVKPSDKPIEELLLGAPLSGNITIEQLVVIQFNRDFETYEH